MVTGNSRKRHNIEKSGVVGHLDLPGDRLPKEEEELVHYELFKSTGTAATDVRNIFYPNNHKS